MKHELLINQPYRNSVVPIGSLSNTTQINTIRCLHRGDAEVKAQIKLRVKGKEKSVVYTKISNVHLQSHKSCSSSVERKLSALTERNIDIYI